MSDSEKMDQELLIERLEGIIAEYITAAPIAAERERCAKIAEEYRNEFDEHEYGDAYSPYQICTDIAAKIRRGE